MILQTIFKGVGMAAVGAPNEANLQLVDPQWEVVERVLASKALQQSPRLREMFRYICHRILREGAKEVREIEIGTNVFGRASDFDPAHDTIVRVQASQLRKKIARYFEEEGIHEPLLLDIAKGNYLPVFRERQPVSLALAASTPRPTAAPPPSEDVYKATTFALAGIVLLLVAALAWSMSGRSAATRTSQKKEPHLQLLWSQLLVQNQPTKILLADTSLAFVTYLLHGPVSLSSYLDRSYLNKLQTLPQDLRQPAEVLANRQYTGIADAEVTAEIMGLASGSGAKVSVAYTRDFNLRQFQSANVILLGSRISNPWVELFEQQFNFRYGRSARGLAIENRHPKPGEETIYVNTSATGVAGESYGVVAFLPNMDRSGNVLVIAGLDMEATEAIGTFITTEDLFGPFSSQLLPAPGGRLPYFEGLVRATKLSGTVRDLKLIAHRVLAF